MEAQLQALNAKKHKQPIICKRTVFNWEAVLFIFILNIMMTTKQYIQNKDVKLKLFDWAWATKDTEKYRIYNALLDNFLSDKDVAKLKFRPKILFMWHLYCGALQDYVINGKNEKLNDIIKRCPLSKRELKTLFGV